MTQENKKDNFQDPFINDISEPLENNISKNSKNILAPSQNIKILMKIH